MTMAKGNVRELPMDLAKDALRLLEEEQTALEIRCTGNGTVGSNPTRSANFLRKVFGQKRSDRTLSRYSAAGPGASVQDDRRAFCRAGVIRPGRSRRGG